MLAPRFQTLLEMLEHRASEQPERPALTFEETVTTFGELWRRIHRAALMLRRRGLEDGDRVVIALPNGPELFVAFYGVQRAGGIAVPVFPRSGARRLQGLADLCEARWCIVVDSKALDRGPAVEGLEILCSNELGERGIDIGVDIGVDPRGDAGSARLPKVRPDDLAYIQYTSGSTGEPKGVALSHAMVLVNLEQLIAGMRITPREVFVSWLPVHHDMGLVLATMVPFYLAAKLVLLPASLTQVRQWLTAIEQHRGTFTAAPDFAYRLCLQRVRDPAAFDLSSLRVALNAAEPVRTATLEGFEAAFGLQHVMVAGYGLAEATVGVSMAEPGWPWRADERGCVAVGKPFPAVELAILRDGTLVGPGEVGEILVRSPANTRGYYRAPETRRQLFWHGYLRTGDLGYLDASGELFVVGRAKNLIIHGGRNIAPREIEEVVDRLPAVRSSAAVGIDRGRAEGEQVFVFVEVRPRSATEDAERQALVIQTVGEIHRELGFRPGRVYLMKPRAIPLTHNGKVKHRELAARYRDGRLRDEGWIVFPDY